MNWYFGTDGLTPGNDVDFETTSMHEVGHGLGFFATLDADNPGTGGCALGRGCYGFDGFFGKLLPGIFDTKVVACPNTHFLTPGVTGSGQSAFYGNKTTALHKRRSPATTSAGTAPAASPAPARGRVPRSTPRPTGRAAPAAAASTRPPTTRPATPTR